MKPVPQIPRTRALRVQVMSDLHLEFNGDFQAAAAPDADVLVLAGDIGSYKADSKLLSAPTRDFGLGQFRAQSHGGRWPNVLFVPGNHEYDRGDFDEIDAELRAITASLGMQWLERQSVEIQGVRFVGTTLWTDFNSVSTTLGTSTKEDCLRSLSEAMLVGQPFLTKSATFRHGRLLSSEMVRDHALVCQEWLAEALSKPFDGPTVVVTHYAPSLKSADPRYGLTPTTASFCNALDSLLEKADYWIHGHVHCGFDYSVPAPKRPSGECRVICNPLGLPYKDEHRHYDPLLTISV